MIVRESASLFARYRQMAEQPNPPRMNEAMAAVVAQTAAERRDFHIALAANRGIIIAELVQVLKDVRPLVDDVIGARIDQAIKRGKEA